MLINNQQYHQIMEYAHGKNKTPKDFTHSLGMIPKNIPAFSDPLSYDTIYRCSRITYVPDPKKFFELRIHYHDTRKNKGYEQFNINAIHADLDTYDTTIELIMFPSDDPVFNRYEFRGSYGEYGWEHSLYWAKKWIDLLVAEEDAAAATKQLAP